MERYGVTGFALEDGSNARRSDGSLSRAAALVEYARGAGLTCTQLSRRALFEVFGLESNAPNHTLSGLLAEYFPELKAVLPSRRRFFENESERVNVFRAVALAGASLSVMAGG